MIGIYLPGIGKLMLVKTNAKCTWRTMFLETHNTLNQNEKKLLSPEMGKLWVTFMGNTMGKCIISYYLKHVDDQEIKQVLENAHQLSIKLLKRISETFTQENFPLPIGFTSDDVNVNAPRLYNDEFYLHYLKYTCKAGLSIYTIAIPLMTKPEIREFFIDALNDTIKLLTNINQTLEKKGYITDPPQIPIPDQVDFIKRQSYLNGFIGDTRSLHALEITHLYDNIDNNITSKALLIGFSQVAKDESVRKFMVRGKNITDKHIRANSQKLHKEHLPSPTLIDHLVTSSTESPFSDKIMLAHKIDMFSMKIRSYANAMSLNGRRDIGAMYTRMLLDVGLYVEDGTNIMIDRGWMEQPPKAIDRKKLSKR
jgi:hypothetical protein